MTLHPNKLEQLDRLKQKTGYSEFIIDFAQRLRTEPTDAAKMVENMEKSIRFVGVEAWGNKYDRRTTGETLSGSAIGKTTDSENADTVRGMASDYSDELGGLRANDSASPKYLDPEENFSSLETAARELVEEALSFDDSNLGRSV